MLLHVVRMFIVSKAERIPEDTRIYLDMVQLSVSYDFFVLDISFEYHVFLI